MAVLGIVRRGSMPERVGAEDAGQILDMLKLDVESCETLARARASLTPHYLIRAKQGRFFLKVDRPVQGTARVWLRRFFGNPALSRQVAVCRALSSQAFRHFRYPKLIGTDGMNYLLLEYVTPQGRAGSHQKFKSRLVLSLLEFQMSGLKFRHEGAGKLLLDLALNPYRSILQHAFFTVRRRCGLRFALRCLRTAMVCTRLQPKLAHPVVVHNDFHHDNVLLVEGDRMYITDFENVIMERRWLLLDVVHYAVGTKAFCIDLELIRQYLLALQDRGFGGPVNVAAQLRFSLLKRMMQHLASDAPSERVKRQCEQFLSTVLLPEDAYRRWFMEHFEKPQLKGIAA